MEHLAHLLAFAVGCGLFADLYSFCLGDPHEEPVRKGRILSRLGLWLIERYHREQNRIEAERKRREALQLEHARLAYYETPAYTVEGKPFNAAKFVAKQWDRPNWWKLTGVCPKCFLTWFAFILYLVILFVSSASLWWLLFLPCFLGFASLALGVAHYFRRD